MYIKDFLRVLVQGQDILKRTLQVLETQGLKAAVRYYLMQKEEFQLWIKDNVDTTKVNTSPIEMMIDVPIKRDTEAFKAQLQHALTKILNYQETRRKEG